MTDPILNTMEGNKRVVHTGNIITVKGTDDKPITISITESVRHGLPVHNFIASCPCGKTVVFDFLDRAKIIEYTMKKGD